MALSTSLLIRRGARKRCPVCNQGHLFRRWVSMVDACPTCGLVFRRIDGQWLGSWFLNICVAQAAVALALIIGVAITWPAPPMWPIGAAAVAAAVAVPFLFFPYSRTLWTAIDLAMRPLEFEEGVAPGFELDGDPDPRPGPGGEPDRRPDPVDPADPVADPDRDQQHKPAA